MFLNISNLLLSRVLALFLCFLNFTPLMASGIPSIHVSSDVAEVDLSKHPLDIFMEPGASLSWDAFLNAPSSYDFISITSARFGYTADAMWIRFELTYGGESARNFDLTLADSIYEHVDAFIRPFGTVGSLYKGGVSVPPSDRPLGSRIIGFPITLDPRGPTTVFMRISSRHVLQVSMKLFSHEAYLQKNFMSGEVAGALMGFLSVIVILSVLFTFSMRHLDYWIYLGFVTVTTLLILNLHGILDYYLPLKDGNSWGGILGLFSTLSMFFGLYIFRRFLKLDVQLPKIDFVAFILSWFILGIGLTGCFSPIFEYSYLIDLGVVGSFILIFISALYLCWAKAPRAFGYALAWVPLIVGGLYTLLGRYGLVDRNFISDYAIIVGYALHVLMIMLVLSLEILGFKIAWRSARSDASFALFKLDEKTRMIRMLVHDLATPVTLLLMIAGREKSKIAEKDFSSSPWSTVLHAVDQLRSILDLVREVEAATSGKVPLDNQSVNLQDVINEIQFMFQDRLSRKNIRLICDFSLDDPLLINGDRRILVFSVFGNLISNAIKFTPEGGRIKLEVIPAGKDKIEVKLSDTGVGIPANKLHTIFSGFHMTSTLGTSGEKGTGFGLPLVKSFLEQMGASIVVSSRSILEFPMNSGTEFLLRFNRIHPDEKESSS